MQITTAQIEERLSRGFSSKYKAFGAFVDSALWQHCLSALRDETLLSHIIFCNDVLRLPPAHVFLRARPIPGKLSEFEKRSVGAFWGFVFKFIFGYEHQRSVTITAPDREQFAAVRTASYFSGAPSPVEIVKE